MKKALYQRWRAAWRSLGEYIFVGNQNRSLREQVLVVLERVQEFCTRLPQASQGKKRGRLIRRALPSLFCLLVAFILFAPAHAQSAPPTRARIPAAAKQQTGASTDCNDATTKYDALTGLPTPGQAATNPCTVPTRTECLADNVAPNLSAPIIQGSATPDWFFNGGNGLLFTINYVSPDSWKIVLVIALTLLTGPLVLAGYQIALGTASTHYAGAIAIISRVVLVALLAVASYTLITWLFTLASDLASALNANADFSSSSSAASTNVVIPASDWCLHVQNFFGSIYNLNIDQLLSVEQNLQSTDYSNAVYTATVHLVNDLPDVIKTLLSILLAAQLLIRTALLWLYFTISPLAIVSGSLPGESGKNVAWAWLRGLLALLFVQTLQLLVLGIGRQLIPASLTTGSDWFNQAMAILLPAIVLITTLNIPRLLNVSVTNTLSTVSGSMGGAMTSVILILRGF